MKRLGYTEEEEGHWVEVAHGLPGEHLRLIAHEQRASYEANAEFWKGRKQDDVVMRCLLCGLESAVFWESMLAERNIKP